MIIYVLGTFGIYNPAYYTSRLGSLNTSAAQTLQSIYDVIARCQKESRFEESLYEDFFYKVTTGDICAAVSTHP